MSKYSHENVPIKGDVWKHTASGAHYEIVGSVYNTLTDRLDVLYRPLYPCDYSLFSRQMAGGVKAFLSLHPDGSPRFVRVAFAGMPHKWEWYEPPQTEGGDA